MLDGQLRLLHAAFLVKGSLLLFLLPLQFLVVGEQVELLRESLSPSVQRFFFFVWAQPINWVSQRGVHFGPPLYENPIYGLFLRLFAYKFSVFLRSR